MLKIFIITQDEPFFIPKMIQHLINNQGRDFKISGITVLKPHRDKKNMIHWYKERYKVYSASELFIASFAYIYTKIINTLRLTDNYSARLKMKNNNVEEIKTFDINDKEYCEKLDSRNIDIIVSISCPQIFQSRLISIPKLYALNAHGTLLPRHRGVFGTWWTLYYDDKVGGSSIHTMDLELDRGNNLWQQEFNVERKDTQYSLAFKTKRAMASGLVTIFEKLSNEIKIDKVQNEYGESYHRAPTTEQGKYFHERGKSIIKIRDLKYILRSSF